MRLLISANGSLGDIYPALGLGRAVMERGHDVRIITTQNFEELVAGAGLGYIELADAATYEVMRDSFDQFMAQGKAIWSPKDPPEEFITLPERLYGKIEENFVPGETILATLEFFTYGAGAIANEKLGIPYVSLWHNVFEFRAIQPWLPPSFSRVERAIAARVLLCIPPLPKIRDGLDRLRGKLNLPPRNFAEAIFHAQQLSLCLFPRWFTPWYRDKIANAVFSDFPRHERFLDHGLSPELSAFLDRGAPPVVFSTASWRMNRAAYFETALKACEQLGVRAIFQGLDADHFAKRSDRVFAAASLPYTSLLPRSAAFVHHGGIGSVASGLAAGVPQLVVPMGNDTPYNGRKLKQFGAGMTLANKRYSRELTTTLAELLSSDSIARSAQALAQRFSLVPNLDPAVNAVETLSLSPVSQR